MVEVFEELGTELKNLSQSDSLKDMISMFDALDGKQGNLKDQLKGIISVLVKVGMVIVPIITALAALGGAMLLLEPIFSLLGSLAGVFVSILSVGLGPILGILAAIAAVIYTIYENWDLVVSWFEPAIDLMMSGLDQLAQAWESLQPFIEAIMPLLEFVAQLIGGVIVWALSLLVRMWANGFNTIASAINMVCSLLGTLGEIIKTIAGGLSGIIDQALEFLGLSGNISGVNMSAMNSLVPAPSFSYGGDNVQTNNYTFTSPTQLYPAQKSNNLFFQRND
jgi:phage-related protein